MSALPPLLKTLAYMGLVFALVSLPRYIKRALAVDLPPRML